MTSQQIQYFLSAAKHLSFTKAAEEFYTSQPTISRQIAALEEELGFELFYREGKQLRLTSGGLVMLSEFNQQQQSLQSAIQRVEQIESGFEGELKECDEGDLRWVSRAFLNELPKWEGDRIFLDLLWQDAPFFLLKLRYDGDKLVEAVLNGEKIR